MKKPDIPYNEKTRQAALDSYQIVGTLPEQIFDDATYIASQICNTPIALVSLVDKDRQWFKSKVGIDADETHRDLSFCGHAINTPHQIFEVQNTKEDKRFSDNPLVAGDLNIGFYAGVPLTNENEMALGTLCVIDQNPKELNEQQKKALKALARDVVYKIEARKRELELEKKSQINTELLKKLEQTNFRFQSLIESAPLGIVVTDLKGSIIQTNEVLENMLEYSKEEFQKMSVSKLTYSADINKTKLNMKKLIEGKVKQFTMEKRYVAKDGSLIWGRISSAFVPDSNGHPAYLIGTIENINEEKQVKQELQRSKNFLSKITNIIPNIIYVFNQKTMSNEYANREIGATLGYSVEEVQELGERLMPSLCHPDDLNRLFEHFEAVARLEDETVAKIEYRMKHKDGIYRWLLSEDTVFERNGEGLVVKQLGVATDITELKEVQEKLSEQTIQLQKRNEDLKQFTYVATHDLKSPIANIKGFFNLLKKEVKDNTPKVAMAFKHIEKEIQNFTTTQEGLTKAIKIREDKIIADEIEVSKLLGELIDSAQSEIEAINGDLYLDMEEGILIKTNLVYFKSIIQNLISNAIKYRSPERVLKLKIAAKKNKNKLNICVEDNGLGIDLELQRNRIFGMFNRFHHHSEGSGMGLYIVKSMVEKLNGNITIESSVNKGTSFQIELKLL